MFVMLMPAATLPIMFAFMLVLSYPPITIPIVLPAVVALVAAVNIVGTLFHVLRRLFD
ncbi:hypothetical protein GCM10008020_39630 [Massilia psychrophila]|nr:hypothetical protein GCM10008020_39630 [Massilia psychrophila]